MFLPTIGFFIYCVASDNLYSGMEILIGGIAVIQLLVLSNRKRKARNSHPLVRFMTTGCCMKNRHLLGKHRPLEYIRDAHYHGIIVIRYYDSKPSAARQFMSGSRHYTAARAEATSRAGDVDAADCHRPVYPAYHKIDFLLLLVHFKANMDRPELLQDNAPSPGWEVPIIALILLKTCHPAENVFL